jgi:hypothetical protein
VARTATVRAIVGPAPVAVQLGLGDVVDAVLAVEPKQRLALGGHHGQA